MGDARHNPRVAQARGLSEMSLRLVRSAATTPGETFHIRVESVGAMASALFHVRRAAQALNADHIDSGAPMAIAEIVALELANGSRVVLIPTAECEAQVQEWRDRPASQPAPTVTKAAAAHLALLLSLVLPRKPRK